MIVFILSQYEEHGANDVIVVSSRSDIEFAIDSNKSWMRYPDSWKAIAKATLKELLATNTDDELAEGSGKYDLHEVWGGMQLHVRRIEEHVT